MSPSLQLAFWKMEFPQRLAKVRKERGLTQQQLADMAGIHVVQVRRYEGGVSQPAVDVFKRLAVALSISADALLFDESERGPGDDMALQFEAVQKLPPNEQQVVREVLDSLIIKYQTRRWDSARTAG